MEDAKTTARFASNSASAQGTREQEAAPKLSPVVGRLKPSKTAVVADLARRLKEQGQDVISLAIGEPDFPTPEPVTKAAIEAILAGFTHYTQNTGIRALRTAICQKLKRENGLEYTEECIVVSNGAKQAALQGILSTCGPGDEVLIPAPYWVSYPQMAVLAGATSNVIPCPMADGFLLNTASLKNALTEKSRLLILCTPSNPSGAMYRREHLEAIAEIVLSHPRLLVLSDEIYEYMAYSPAEHISLASLPGMYERTLTVNGFSKAFAMTGWRLGYIAAPAFYAKACAFVQSHLTSCPCSISQKAGIAALEMGYKGGSLIHKMIETYQTRRDYAIQRLRAMDGVKVLKPDGAFYAFPDMSAFFGAGARADGSGTIETSEDLCEYLLHQGLIALVPGGDFGAPNHVRISYATSMDLLEKALDRLEQALAKIVR